MLLFVGQSIDRKACVFLTQFNISFSSVYFPSGLFRTSGDDFLTFFAGVRPS